MKKRGQSGINAAILVAVIAAVIVIYIIFLPNEDKKDLLEGNYSDSSDDDEDYEDLLFSDKVGRLEFISKINNEHAIDSFNIFTRTEAEIIKELDSATVRKGWFENQETSMNFSVKDLDNTDNLLLSFSNKKSAGNLIVKLNNQEIFNKEVTNVNIEPIKLPKESLASRNTITFGASGVGILFWKTNEYQMEDIKISADVTDISTRESNNMFIVSDYEAENIEEATLMFVPECQPRLTDKLEITLNNNPIYSSVPDCGTLVKRRLNPSNILSGENKIVFKSEEGDYLIDRISIDTKLKDSPSYTNYFDVSDEQLKDIVDDKKDVNLTIVFVDDIEEKEAEVIVNGRKFFVPRTKELEYSKNIDDYIDGGSNSVKIIPKVTLDIRELRIEMNDND